MKKVVLSTFIILFLGFLKAQSSSVSTDNNKIIFVVTDKTTKTDIEKAENVFGFHNISTDINASWEKGRISKLKINVKYAQSNVKYYSANPDDLKKGIKILVDKNPNAAVAIRVGSNLGK